MSDVFRAIRVRDVAGSIEEVLLPRLTEALRNRVPGHCMRVSDLDSDLMGRSRQGSSKPGHPCQCSCAHRRRGERRRRSLHLVDQAGRAPESTAGRDAASPAVCLPSRESAHERRRLVRQCDLRGVSGWGHLRRTAAAAAGARSFDVARLRAGDSAAPARATLAVGGCGGAGSVSAVCAVQRKRRRIVRRRSVRSRTSSGLQVVRPPDRCLWTDTQESRMRPPTDGWRLGRSSAACWNWISPTRGCGAGWPSISTMLGSRIRLPGLATSSSTARTGIFHSTSGSSRPRSRRKGSRSSRW